MDADQRAARIFGALFLIIFGILQVVLEVQSPSFIMFDGIRVTGSTINGSTAYRYHGHGYHVVDKIDHSTRRQPTTVWLSRSDPSDPSRAYVDQTSVRWIDIVTTAGPFVAAGVLVLIGFVRDVRRRADFAHRIGLPGSGIPDDFVARQIQLRRSPPPPPPPEP